MIDGLRHDTTAHFITVRGRFMLQLAKLCFSFTFVLAIAFAPAFTHTLSTVASAQARQIEIWKQQGWKTDFSKMSVTPGSILNGGPPRDGIPPIDSPQFVPVEGHDDLDDREPVIGLSIKGDHRAYPLRIMTWHEIVNDVVGGKPVTVTYCPLCNAAIVFEATLDGVRMDFGTTGKLRKSDLIMYDRQSDSWWQQFTGKAIAGAMLGKTLALVPARLENWRQFRERHPDGRVLVPNNRRLRDYGRNPYVSYDTADRPFLYRGAMPKGIEPMERVVVVRRAEAEPLIVKMALLANSQKRTIEGLAFSFEAGQASALDTPKIAKGRDVGTVTVTKDGALMPYDVTFAFVAHAFHPNVEIMK
ncbi:MAG: DUF3179 domain-containing protein [Pseudomonadota bacterium]